MRGFFTTSHDLGLGDSWIGTTPHGQAVKWSSTPPTTSAFGAASFCSHVSFARVSVAQCEPTKPLVCWLLLRFVSIRKNRWSAVDSSWVNQRLFMGVCGFDLHFDGGTASWQHLATWKIEILHPRNAKRDAVVSKVALRLGRSPVEQILRHGVLLIDLSISHRAGHTRNFSYESEQKDLGLS